MRSLFFMLLSLPLAALAGGARGEEANKPELAAASVVVTNAKARPTQSVLSDVEIDFDIKNASQVVFKAVLLHAVLQSPGRAIPWIEDDIGYKFPGGLEPGETKHLRLTPNLMSDWRHFDPAWLKTGVLSLTPTEIEDPSDAKLTVQK